MSGIAILLQKGGWLVHGHENHASRRTENLADAGVTMHYGNSVDPEIGVVEFAVFSSIEDAEELRQSFHLAPSIPLYTQFALIDQLASGSTTVAIAGSYGKTTTTALVVNALDAAGLEPFFTCGGQLLSQGANARRGTSPIWVIEAVETHDNLLHLHPTHAVILNIEDRRLLPVFEAFALSATEVVIVDVGDPGGRALFSSLRNRSPALSMAVGGISADYSTCHSHVGRHAMGFTLLRGGVSVGRVSARSTTALDIGNLLAASAVAHCIGIPHESIASGIESCLGVVNRFQVRIVATRGTVITDIAHHPASIRTSIDMARHQFGGRIVVVYRPHMFRELGELASETGAALERADKIILRDVLSFKDHPISGRTSKDFVAERCLSSKWTHGEPDLVTTISAALSEPVTLLLMGMYQDEDLTDRACSLVAEGY